MPNGPTVSVLMPVRNGMAYVDEAIRSICAQTLSDWELIIVDDGSSDSTPAILDSWAKRDSRIKLVRLEPSGLVAASNAAVAAARGHYLARLDADDIAHPSRLALQVACMERRPKLAVIGSAIKLIGGRSGLLFTPMTNWGCRGRLLFENSFAHSSVMMRRSMVEKLFPLYQLHTDYAEDLALWIRLLPVGEFGNLPVPLVKYRVHQRQISREKVQILQEKHAGLAVGQWRQWGIEATPENFTHFRWPDFEKNNPISVLKHSVRMAVILSPMLLTRYAPQAAFWIAKVCLRNIIKSLVPHARRIL